MRIFFYPWHFRVECYAGIHEKELCIRMSDKEIAIKGFDIDEEYFRGEPVGQRTSAYNHFVIPIADEELVDSLRYQMVTEMNDYIHLSLLSNVYTPLIEHPHECMFR